MIEPFLKIFYMSNYLIFGANSPMVEDLIFAINKNENDKLFLFINNLDKFKNGLGQKLDMKNVELFCCDLLTDKVFELLDNINVKIDSFCYVSGSTHLSLIKFLKRDYISNVFEVNFFKPLFITQYLLKKKLVALNANFVYVSSISGINSVAPGILSYSSSKASLNNLVKVLTLECKSLNIKFNTICPGIVQTDFNKDIDKVKASNEDLLLTRYPLGYGIPSDISSLIKYLLTENTWITGQNISIDGGFTIN
jgi:NAD(P)-dependent dehydrogenase (short-subunit alcohol dehydrogenase family)